MRKLRASVSQTRNQTDFPEAGFWPGADAAIHCPEKLLVIEDVEHFHTKLKRFGLGDARLLLQRHIEIVQSRAVHRWFLFKNRSKRIEPELFPSSPEGK
jgi:hypothetical protein